MSSDLDDYYENRVKQKHKGRHTYPNKHDETPRILQRHRSFPSVDDESSEQCIIKEYSRNRLKTEIVITKRTKVRPRDDGEPELEPELDAELVAKCFSAVSRKILRLLCYLTIL
jgi:hypothetical protein